MLYHLEDIEKIREVEKEVSNNGYKVFDISHWDSGKDYNKLLLSSLEIQPYYEPFKYIYNYEISPQIHSLVENKLLQEANTEICSILIPSSTLSIVNIANFLQKHKLNKICLLQPSYFTVEPCLNASGLHVETRSLELSGNKFIIPLEDILSNNYDVIWITSPVFCTGTYFDETEITKLQLILDNQRFIICDESLSILGYSLRKKLSNSKFLITIHSPHKVISTNSIKFSCILCNNDYKDFFDQWIDLFCGGLPLSSYIAANHFISENYDNCLKMHLDYTDSIKQSIVTLLNKYDGQISFSHNIGQYMSIFYPMVPFKESIRFNFIKRLITCTHVSLLPGYLEGFYQELGFCFRVNLTLDKTLLITSINKVLQYLKNNYP